MGEFTIRRRSSAISVLDKRAVGPQPVINRVRWNVSIATRRNCQKRTCTLNSRRVHLNEIISYKKFYRRVVTCLKSVGNSVVSNYRDNVAPLQSNPSQTSQATRLRGEQPTISRHLRNGDRCSRPQSILGI